MVGGQQRAESPGLQPARQAEPGFEVRGRRLDADVNAWHGFTLRAGPGWGKDFSAQRKLTHSSAEIPPPGDGASVLQVC